MKKAILIGAVVALLALPPGAYALGESTRELTHAYSRYAVLDHVIHRQAKRLSTRPPPAHAAFRYRKGGLCHHYHYYKPKYPDC